jgi:hypothetical protein
VSCSSTGAKFDMETDIIRNGSGKAESRCNDVGATSSACHPEPQL